MGMAIAFTLWLIAAGFALLRLLGLGKGGLVLGLAPGVGLALLAVVATWPTLLGAPPPVAGVLVLAVGASGLGYAWHDRRTIVDALCAAARAHRLAIVLLAAAVSVPVVVMSLAFGGVQVPLSPHDGAAHTEAIQAYRLGQAWPATAAWYPPGLTALFAAWLQLFPGLDSAQGAFELGTSLPLLATLAVAGLAMAVWRDPRTAAVAALLLGLTYLYPYFPQVWSGWPLAASLVLVIGLWTVSLEYLARPSWRWASVGGVLLGGIVVVHGSELYTVVIILSIVLMAGWRRVTWPALGRHLGLVGAIALLCAAVYVPALAHWAGTGGAYAVGLTDGQAAPSTLSVPAGPVDLSTSVDGVTENPFGVFVLGALGIDLPLRLGLLVVGIGWAIRRRRGGSVLAVGLTFAGLAGLFTTLSGVAAIHQLYAVVFPWGMHYRLLMLVAVAQVLLAAAGGVVVGRWAQARATGPGSGRRRAGRALRVCGVAWVVLATWATSVFVSYPTDSVLGYSDDDAAAMAWLRAQAAPGEMLINDGYADAGIWAPYKAGVPILLPRWAPGAEDAPRRLLVIANIARLDHSPEAASIACELHARYVLRGSRASAWDERQFPSLAELRASTALQEVFHSGDAVVFRTRLSCP